MRDMDSYRYWIYIKFYDDAKFIGRIGIAKANGCRLFDMTPCDMDEIHIRDQSILVKARRVM